MNTSDRAVPAHIRQAARGQRSRPDAKHVTWAARLAPRLSPRAIAAGATLLYPRFEPELRRLDDFCPRGGTMVDVGGWYGPWTRRLARRADSVVTIEPVPHLACLLAATAAPNVCVAPVAAADRTGTAQLWLPPGGRGDRGIASLVRRPVHGAVLDVPCLPLDDLALSEVTFIKVDVDGSELAVLKGARKTLCRHRPALFIELEARIQPLEPVLSLLDGHGYRGWVLPRHHWVPLTDFDLSHHQQRTSHVAEHGFVRRSVLPHRRYINSVLFLPAPRRPAATSPG